MGAPTSPVLSNLACRALDERLYQFAGSRNWVYTRYSDDFSFSSLRPFGDKEIGLLRGIIQSEGFEINDLKTRNLGPEDEKIVTGILLSGNGALKPGYLEELADDLRKLTDIMEAQNFYGASDTEWVTKMKQQVQGKLAFAGFVLGKKSPEFIAFRQQYKAAINQPHEMHGAVSWQGFHYLQ